MRLCYTREPNLTCFVMGVDSLSEELCNEGAVASLCLRFWELAMSGLPNGMAMIEMADILQEIANYSDAFPNVIARRARPEDVDVDVEALKVAYLAENLWMSVNIRFGDNRDFYPPFYLEQRDRLVDSKTNQLEVRRTENAGNGLFSRRELKLGEAVFVSSGQIRIYCSPYESREVVDTSDGDLRSFNLTSRNPDRHFPNAICIGVEDLGDMVGMQMQDPGVRANVWLDPYLDSPLKFLNHSCNPNVKRGRDGVTFSAMREVGIGEELTCDYSTLEVNPDWQMECKCGAEGCRGVIGGVQTLPSSLIATYGNDLPKFMFDLFRQSHSGVGSEVYRTICNARVFLTDVCTQPNSKGGASR